MKFLTNSLALSMGIALGAQVSLRLGCALQPRPMPHQLANFLDHPLRMRYRNPGEILGLFGLMAGMTILDLGCGAATFTLEMARMVGEEGTVHAVDIQQPLLDVARRRIDKADLSRRVRFHHCGAYELPLHDSSVDLAVMIATLPQIPDKQRALAEMRRVLKPGGRLAISEELPDLAYVPLFVVRRWLSEAGFRYGGKSGSFFCYSIIGFNGKE